MAAVGGGDDAGRGRRADVQWARHRRGSVDPSLLASAVAEGDGGGADGGAGAGEGRGVATAMYQPQIA